MVLYSAFVFAIITFQSLQTIATFNVKMHTIIYNIYACGIYTARTDKVRTQNYC